MTLSDDDAIRLQFVSVLDAWVKLEHQLGKLFYVLLKPIPYPRSQSLFTAINGFQAQREAVMALTDDAIENRNLVEAVSKLLDRGRSLATKRNRLVHGRWKQINVASQMSPKVKTGRVYFPANMRPFTEPNTDIFSLKGSFIFLGDDLKRCETEFAALAHDIDQVRHPIAAALKVSPHIELSDAEVIGLSARTSPPSGHPPENA
jgi:hypothetical protein